MHSCILEWMKEWGIYDWIGGSGPREGDIDDAVMGWRWRVGGAVMALLRRTGAVFDFLLSR